jgi:hypothetical protein
MYSIAMSSDPGIASQKLQTNLDATQKWLNRWRIEANESQSVHVTFTIWRGTCPPVHINNTHLPQQDVKYLGLQLDRRLTWCKHIFAKKKQLGMTHTKMHWLSRWKSTLIYLHIWSNTQTNLDLWNTTVGYGSHFKHRTPRTFPIQSFVHDCRRTLVHAEYGYPKGSPNTNS